MKLTLLVGLVLSSFLLLFSLALAQEAKPLATSPSPQPVEYVLPYPGLLPDHPLYFIKLARDQILLWLITKPQRKAEFYLLTADKRLNMTVFLLDKQKNSLAVKTAKEACSFLKLAETALMAIPAGESDINSLKDRFAKSLLKHQEVMQVTQTRVEPAQQGQIKACIAELEQINQEFSRNK